MQGTSIEGGTHAGIIKDMAICIRWYKLSRLKILGSWLIVIWKTAKGGEEYNSASLKIVIA